MSNILNYPFICPVTSQYPARDTLKKLKARGYDWRFPEDPVNLNDVYHIFGYEDGTLLYGTKATANEDFKEKIKIISPLCL